MDELQVLCSVRDNIRGYIDQADKKALGIVATCPHEHLSKEIYKLYLECISPDIEYPKAPTGYKLMDCRTIEHINYEIEICRKILFYKYEIINRMILIAK